MINDEIPPEIGPHEGRELELMLAGKKPAAMFSDVIPASFEWPEKDFEPYVLSGEIIKREEVIESSNGNWLPSRYVYYAIPGEEPRIDKLSHLNHCLYGKGEKTSPKIEREIGRLLGYDDKDIKVFIDRFFEVEGRES